VAHARVPTGVGVSFGIMGVPKEEFRISSQPSLVQRMVQVLFRLYNVTENFYDEYNSRDKGIGGDQPIES